MSGEGRNALNSPVLYCISFPGLKFVSEFNAQNCLQKYFMWKVLGVSLIPQSESYVRNFIGLMMMKIRMTALILSVEPNTRI